MNWVFFSELLANIWNSISCLFCNAPPLAVPLWMCTWIIYHWWFHSCNLLKPKWHVVCWPCYMTASQPLAIFYSTQYILLELYAFSFHKETLIPMQLMNLSHVQSGCCKPPTGCNFTYQSETVWTKPAGFNTTTDDPDCTTWSNDQTVLCYDCMACKAGVLANLKNDWKKIATVNIVFLIFLVVVYSVGCCAFRNNRQDNSYPAWKWGARGNV